MAFSIFVFGPDLLLLSYGWAWPEPAPIKPEHALKSYFRIQKGSFSSLETQLYFPRLALHAGPILAPTRITPQLFLDPYLLIYT